ncbi:LINE-1 reverse transcriptase-like [Vitis vinifera]|uniref:LINE-1 reverse transcriptase-like n=1 Tax=Vitis vinifera TaxID=29760 RepID=A0A438IQ29_VITVI|nr:LINE-1 reverse transcriptase-like [Vitis vinifera]
MSEGVVRSLGSGRFLDWRALDVDGAAGGLLICWDKRSLEIVDWEEGQYSLSCRFKNVEDGAVWVFTGSLWPIHQRGKRMPVGRAGGYQFSGVIQRRLSRLVSDHFPILLEGGGLRRGPSPFRFENMWLKVEGFLNLIRNWWKEIEVRGTASYRLAAKMKELKQKLKLGIERSLEIWKMSGDKAPGPDGFTMAFWQSCWDFVKGEILEMFKEFHEQSSFLKSLNNTFLVLIPKKGGAADLGDFRPIRRQILDASLIANEVIDSWQKRKEKGFICKLDIEKAYDNINWQFLLKTLHKMGFGSKWLGWMWSCVSSAKFSVLVNGVPAGFFLSSQGLRQGDPPYLFVLGMEVLDALIRRAVVGGYLSGCSIQGDRRHNLKISHLFFADDTIMFCEANKEHLTHLSWILLWFEAASGLRINLDKSEIIPVGVVEEIEEMAVELGCRVGSLPSQYLGLPLGAPNKAPSVWDGVEEKVRRRLAWWKRQYISKGGRITLIRSTLASMPIYHMSLFRMPKSVARRLDKVQRDFLWGGGSVERKAHLIKWEAICEDKSKGGLGLRKLVLLNKALLGKWIWRFAYDKDDLWKQVITTKYGQEGHGWRAKRAYGAFGVGVWKEIWKETDWLSQNFPHLFVMAAHRNATVEEMWDQNFGQGGWNLRFLRDFNDWEMDMIGNLLHVLRDYKPSMEEDSVCWKGGRNDKFRVKEAYRLVARPNDFVFPSRCIWVDSVPTKVAFFAWEATWGGCSLLIGFRKRMAAS